MDARDAVSKAALLDLDELRSIAGVVSNSLERVIALDAALKSGTAAPQAVKEVLEEKREDVDLVFESRSLIKEISRHFSDPSQVGAGESEASAPGRTARAGREACVARELVVDPLDGVAEEVLV